VGTLLHPAVAVAQTYAAVGHRFGSRLTTAKIAKNFRKAYVREELADRQMEWRTDEERERRRWQNIVASTLEDVNDPDACFRELFDHYARPQSWRLTPAVGRLLHELDERKMILGIASNYDSRLRSVVAGFEELTPLKHLLVSSEIGYRKPAQRFFEAMMSCAACHPSDVVYVGDDIVNDVEAARSNGLRAALFNAREPTDWQSTVFG
jgi:putative hydrolase of the HAD superfamily